MPFVSPLPSSPTNNPEAKRYMNLNQVFDAFHVFRYTSHNQVALEISTVMFDKQMGGGHLGFFLVTDNISSSLRQKKGIIHNQDERLKCHRSAIWVCFSANMLTN